MLLPSLLLLCRPRLFSLQTPSRLTHSGVPSKVNKFDWKLLFAEFTYHIHRHWRRPSSVPHSKQVIYLESEKAIRKQLLDVQKKYRKLEDQKTKQSQLTTSLSAQDLLEMDSTVHSVIQQYKITSLDELFSRLTSTNERSVNYMNEYFRGSIASCPKSSDGAIGALEMLYWLRYRGNFKIRVAETVMESVELSNDRDEGYEWLARIYAQSGDVKKLEAMRSSGRIGHDKVFFLLTEACTRSKQSGDLFRFWDRLRHDQKAVIGHKEYLAMTRACKDLRFLNLEYRTLLDDMPTDGVEISHQMAFDLVVCCELNKDWIFAKLVYAALLDTRKHPEYPIIKSLIKFATEQGDAGMVIELCKSLREHRSHRALLVEALEAFVVLKRWENVQVVLRSMTALRVKMLPRKMGLYTYLLEHYKFTSDWTTFDEIWGYLESMKCIPNASMISIVIDASAARSDWQNYDGGCAVLKENGQADRLVGIVHSKMLLYLSKSNWTSLRELWRHVKRGPISNDTKILSIIMDASLRESDWALFDEIWAMTKIQRVPVNVKAINIALYRNRSNKKWVKEFQCRLQEKGFHDTYTSKLTAAGNEHRG